MAIALREDYDATRLRQAARPTGEPDRVRRLLALAVIYDRASPGKAAQIGGRSRHVGAERMMGERTVMQAALFYSFSVEQCVPAYHPLRSIERGSSEADCSKAAPEASFD